jgi:subtilisin family serine protease
VKRIQLAVAGVAALGAATSFAALGPATAAPVHSVAVTKAVGATAIPGSYIVTLKSGVNPHTLVAAQKIAAHYVYTAALNGFAAKLTPGQLTALQHNPAVAAIEQDAKVQLETTQSGATWGIDRIDQRNLPLSGTYSYNSTGNLSTAYVIDTGIYVSDTDFGGRAAVAYDALGGNGIDCNGHGTHVAGTIGGTKYGVAKQVQLRAVRVLDCSGSGSNSGVIAGMNWVAAHHVSRAVANMSLGGGYSSSVNSAATSLVNSGVFLAVASGNSNADACNYSPASASGTVTVNASDSGDNRASFSNYGGCTDIYAPGVNITSDWLNNGTNTISGTSMATPHVTGVAALYKTVNGDQASSTVASWIINNATTGVIKGNPSGTPNRLLYKGTL